MSFARQDKADSVTPDVQIQHIGIQLYQLSSGLDGLTLGNGTLVNSTDQAIRHELRLALTSMRGHDGEVYRRYTERVRAITKTSMESGGARDSMLALSEYFTVV